MKASQIMTRNLRSVAPDTPIRKLAEIMLDGSISAVPVVDPSGVPLGVVSEGDLVRRPEIGTTKRRSWWLAYVADPQGGAEDFIKSHGLTAADVMHRGVIAVGPESTLAEVADLLERRRIKRVYVVERDRIVGVITRSDLVRAVLRTQPPPAGKSTDARIRDAIDERMIAEPWAPRALITVVVADGVVDLLGVVASEAERKALRLLASEVAGVREVKDHLVVRVIPLSAGAVM